MPTATLQVQLVTCQAEIIAEPGQQLMIYDGKCIGVLTAPKDTGPMPSDDVIVSKCSEAKNVHAIATELDIPTSAKEVRAYLSHRVRVLVKQGRLTNTTPTSRVAYFKKAVS